ncbi:hypothetical protein EV213_1322 [Aureibacillus halotolerans]|uniref:Uncharacterized protein n=1 Tax=Aureibacillus halotolerans TaxID=1508390 RepID=A0A4R6TP25_9BACI|nr:hypothetical protein EV213_1322 [Aureibacillus halotolerans]
MTSVLATTLVVDISCPNPPALAGGRLIKSKQLNNQMKTSHVGGVVNGIL